MASADTLDCGTRRTRLDLLHPALLEQLVRLFRQAGLGLTLHGIWQTEVREDLRRACGTLLSVSLLISCSLPSRAASTAFIILRRALQALAG